MSGNSNVGNRGVYEAGDQRTSKASEVGSATRFQEGAPNSHQFNDSSKINDIRSGVNRQQRTNGISYQNAEDSRSLGNRAAAEKQSSDSAQESLETTLGKRDPTLPVSTTAVSFFCSDRRNASTEIEAKIIDEQSHQAKIHGNKPSRGAEIDAELQADDEATLKKKDN